MDVKIYEALALNEDYWEVGDEAAIITTESGGRYIAQPDGSISGGTKSVNGVRLNGSVYRPGGPIRPRLIVFGLSMELATGPGRRVLVTSPVTAIESA